MCFFDPPGDTHAILNRDVAITLAGTIATTKAAKKDWQELDLRAALNREGSDQDLRCDRGGFAFRKASVYHDHDGQPWENTVASAVQWVDRELPFAAALAADILERRWKTSATSPSHSSTTSPSEAHSQPATNMKGPPMPKPLPTINNTPGKPAPPPLQPKPKPPPGPWKEPDYTPPKV